MNKSVQIVALLACITAGIALAVPCTVPDNGNGTADFPPPCPDGYQGHFTVTGGLPEGTTIEIDVSLKEFSNLVEVPGGSLGGDQQTWEALLLLEMDGTGDLVGFQRSLHVWGTNGETHTGPRMLGDPVQEFPTDIFFLEGQVFADPDFAWLRVTAGTVLAMPSPGVTVFSDVGNDQWNVDSFFDITYQIEFEGALGSVLEGMGGITHGEAPLGIGENPIAAVQTTWGELKASYR